jgi:hypothetical protein
MKLPVTCFGGCCDGDFFGNGERPGSKKLPMFNVANKVASCGSRDLAVDIVNHSPF